MHYELHTVVLADDHRLLREEVRDELEERGFDVLAEADDALGAVCAALKAEPDLCLLDVRMPGDGIRAAEAIVRRLPHVKVVMLTTTRDEATALSALRVGAAGYLLKDLDPDRLADTLRRVADGELAYPARLLQRALAELRLNPPGAAALAHEDWRVADLLGEGLSAAQVAEETSLGTDSVRERIAAIAGALRSAGAPAASARG